MLFSNWIELTITQDAEQFIKVSTQLKNAGIAYKEKIQNIGHANRRSGQIGSLGESVNYANLYQIYVKKKDLDRAKASIAHNQASM